MSRPLIVLFGDSITQQSFQSGGWGSALADCYSRKADIVLRGYSGYNTKWALFLLDEIFAPKVEAPLAVTIFFGANDAALPDRSHAHQHVPLTEYKRNVHRIISHIKSISELTRIILITPPPIDEKGRQAFARETYGANTHELPERTNEMAGEYSLACKVVAQEANVPVLDLWTIFQATDNWQGLYLSDGLHLTPEGNRVVYEELIKVLGTMGLAESDLPLDFPLHSSINFENPEGLGVKVPWFMSTQAALAYLIKQAGDSRILSQCRTLQAHIWQRKEHKEDRYLSNLMIEMFAKCGSIQDAQATFNTVQDPNIFTVNIMLSAYAQKGQFGTAIDFFLRTSQRNVVTWTTILVATAREGNVLLTRQIFQKMPYWDTRSSNALLTADALCGDLPPIKTVFDGIYSKNLASWTILISAYAHEGDLQVLNVLLNKMPHCSVLSWNMLLKAYVDKGGVISTKEVFDRMPERNKNSWILVFEAYAQSGHLYSARSVLYKSPEMCLVCMTSMLSGYGNRGLVTQAEEIFAQMKYKDVIAWNSMLSAYALNGHTIVKVFFDKMPACDTGSYNILSNKYAKEGDFYETYSVFNTSCSKDLMSWNSLLNAYAQKGHLQESLEFFDKFPKWDSVSWNTLIQGLNESFEDAKRVFESMPERGMLTWDILIQIPVNAEDAQEIFNRMPEWSLLSFTALLTSYARDGCPEQSKMIFDITPRRDLVAWNALLAAYVQNNCIEISEYIFEKIPERDIITGNTMFTAYAQSGDIEEAMKMLSEMNTYGWNTLIGAYALRGAFKEVFNLLKLMVINGFTATEVTFVAVLSVCSHAGLLMSSLEYFRSMVYDYYINPTVDHYCCVVDVFGRSGMLTEAEELVENMPFLPGDVAWRCLLGSCKVHGEAECGSRSAKELFYLQPGLPLDIRLGKYGYPMRISKFKEHRRVVEYLNAGSISPVQFKS